MAFGPGTRLGAYEILSLLGSGGMGEVWRARDLKLQREVAIKVLPEALSDDPERLARFEREAKTLAALSHPNIAHVHGFDDSTGVPALVMELVEGPTLADRIAKGPIPLDEALPIAKQIAEGLEAAHEQGIIHRDLKPANIKVREDGTVKILDFGLAKALEPKQPSGVNVTQSPTITTPAMMTGVGVILGTAAYMSPEQVKGRPADKRSDVWAFGCVLYEMLTGKRAFPGADITDTLAAVLRAEPDWQPLSAPANIALLVRACLVKNRDDRLHDVSTALFLLTHHLDELPALRPSSTWSRVAWAAGVALAAAIGPLVWWVSRPPSRAPVMRFTINLPAGQAFSNTGRQIVAVSPDGTQLVYTANSQLYVRSLNNFEAKPVAGTEGQIASNPVFSPDGQSLAFYATRDHTIKRVGIAGGSVLTICSAEPLYGMTWFGDWIFFGQSTAGVMRVNADGGKPDVVIARQGLESLSIMDVLPAGNDVLVSIAPTQAPEDWDKAETVVQSLRSGARKRLLTSGSDAHYLPTGHLVYALGGVLFAVPFDLTRLELTRAATPILEGVERGNVVGQGTGVAHVGISHNGNIVYVPGPATSTNGVAQRQLQIVDRQGKIETIKLPPGPYTSPRVSPDGHRLTFGTDEGREKNIWVYDLSGTVAPRRLTFGGVNQFPIWSPDGKRVTFQSGTQDAGLYWLPSDGSGISERLTAPSKGTFHIPESWSPDGRHLFFSVVASSGATLWTLSLPERDSARFDDVKATSPLNAESSPDGRWVAYTERGVGTAAIFVQPVPPTGAKYQVSKDDTGHHPLWSHSGSELFYRPGANSLVRINISTVPVFTFSEPTQEPTTIVALTASTTPRNYDIFPDDKRFVITSPNVGDGSPSGGRVNVIINWFEELRARVPVK